MADSRHTKLSWPLLAFLVICLMAMVATIVFVTWTANQMIRCDVCLTAAAKDIRLEGLAARLCFEEIIHGEYPPDMNNVWAHFNNADRNVEALLGATRQAELAYIPVEESHISQEAVIVRQKLKVVSELTRQRWSRRDVQPADQNAGAQYDAVFTDFANSANDLERNLAFHVTQKAGFFRSLAIFSTAVSILMATLILFVVVVYISRRAEFACQQQDLVNKLAEKNDEFESLIYEGSQDMRTPMVNLQGFNAELAASCREITGVLSDPSLPANIKQKLSAVVTRDIPDALNHIRTSVNRINTLVNGLLRLIYLGRVSPRVQSVDMDNIIAEIVENIRLEAERSQTLITVEPLPSCKADPEQIRDVFTALVDNALKYLSPERPGRIRIFGRIEQKRAIYAVEDNGIGIRQEDQAKVFRAFRRIVPLESPPGDGLGLTVIRRLVHQLNGAIWLESEPGKGSTFYVSLPSA